jgi:hypothetical protein
VHAFTVSTRRLGGGSGGSGSGGGVGGGEKPWTKEEKTLLKTAMGKYPKGHAQRWEMVAKVGAIQAEFSYTLSSKAPGFTPP